ncbi:MAG: hypothetical protein A3B78_01355 [Omnitrophica WOR_2 bacterium RIFCSPHIGHO2_02_FULL_67_20]|nr:MAG: hypothetical protein A3B78_01355 [Omnitrophica WOR_2 bacterium RIFCSPHIGHO2_02_FULL_67_20]
MQPEASPPAAPADALLVRSGELRGVLRNVYACYFLSGALGLIYQVLWLRKLLLVFGSTVHAVSTVLTVFFGGLALGSWLFGRLIDRRRLDAGLRWYALLELGIGVYAFVTLPLFDMIQGVYIPIFRDSGFSPRVLVGASFACSAAILLLPTVLMGGTFPLLSRFLIRTSGERGVKIASLYGINTAGAMAGTLFVYYAGLPVLGLTRTLQCAGILNLGIGMLCLTFDRHLQALGFHPARAASQREAGASAEVPGAARWLFLAFGLSGFSAMVYEVAWTRALSLVVGSSTYAFCIMLATFLGGMALGSGLARRHLRRAAGTIGFFIAVELALGAYGLISIPLFSQLPEWLVTLWPLNHSFTAISWLQFSLCSFAMLMPTLLMGVLFPVVSDLLTSRFARLGQRLGNAYAINTLGGIAGSFLSGFVLIPRWGLPWAIVCAALVNLLAAAVLHVSLNRNPGLVDRMAAGAAWLGMAGALSALIIVPSWKRQVFAAGVYLNPEAYRATSVAKGVAGSTLLFYRDSLNATVSVHRLGETIFLKVGGKTDASNGIDMGTQVLSAHIPLLLHPDPKRVLVIGLGSGVTLGHAGRHPVTALHCAEIDEAVIEGARFFKDYNYGVHDDPRTRIFAADGRNVLLASPEQYDVIISEPSNPWMAGIAYLFTREFYGLAKQRLAPGGVMCQWLQLYRIFPSDAKLMLKTFHDAFPYVSVWSSVPGDLLLVGSMEPHTTSVARLRERMANPAVRDALATVKVDRPELLLQLFWLGNREVEQLTQDIFRLHEDDQPSVEFNAPRSLYAEGAFQLNYGGLERFKSAPAAIAPDYDPALENGEFLRSLALLWGAREELERELQADKRLVELEPLAGDAWMQLGQVSLKMRQPLRAAAAFEHAAALEPKDPEARRLLAKLRWEQGLADEAEQLYRQAAVLGPPAETFAAELGDFFAFRKVPRLAAEYYRSALSQGGGSRPELILAFGNTLKELGAWQETEQLIGSGVSAFPSEAALPLLMGEALLAQRRWQEALPWFQRTLAVSPKSADAYYGLGRAALGLGGREEAARQLARALRVDPYHVEAARLLQELRRSGTMDSSDKADATNDQTR